MAIGVFDAPPNFCPMCGNRRLWDTLQSNDWRANASFWCICGFRFQRATTELILSAAECSGGDLEERAI